MNELQVQSQNLKSQIDQKDALIASQAKELEEVKKRLHELELPKTLELDDVIVLAILSERTSPANAMQLEATVPLALSEIQYRLQKLARDGLLRSDSFSPTHGNDYHITLKGREALRENQRSK